MKLLAVIFLLTTSLSGIGQTKIEKTFPLQGRKVELSFDFPELIKVHTWDQKEVKVQGSVSINRGENDNAFELSSETKDGILFIESMIKDKENLPRRTVIKKGDQEYYFRSGDMNNPEIQKFLDENGHSYTYMTNGVDYDITLEIFVPKGVDCKVNAKFGMVEVTNFNASLMVNAPHGGVDATIVPSSTGQLTARTKFGEILTNLDAKFNSNGFDQGHDHWTEVQANFGNGPKFDLESKFGKVYLRKP